MNLALLLLFFSLACRAEVIDRIAVVVGNGVITESEILREIRLTGFLNGESADLSADARRKTAERLVEQHLIRDDIESSAYPEPAPESVNELFKQLRQRFSDESAYQEGLRRAGVTEEEVRAHLVRQVTTLQFLDARFRPGIQIPEEEISKYFAERIVPDLKKAHPGVEPSLNDYHFQVEEALIGERIDKATDDWLKEARNHTRIEFRQAAFASGPAPRAEVSQ